MFDNKKVIAFCDLHGTPIIPGLNSARSLGTVSFLGKFAIMDFTLSNFSNSGIDRVGILVHRFPRSVLSHIENGLPWIRNTKTGFQYIMYNEEGIAKPTFNTDIANIVANSALLEREQYDYIVVAPIYYLSAMDYRPIIEDHIESGASVSAVYIDIENGKHSFEKSKLVEIDSEGNVTRFKRNVRRKDKVSVSLDTFIINREVFDDMLQKYIQVSKSSSLRDLIAWLAANDELVVRGHKFEESVFPIFSLEDYIEASFACLRYEHRQKLFKPDWPIYTTSHDTPPAKYGKNARTSDCIISNGAIINGTVKRSVISRNVVIEEGATVEDSIIFTGTKVRKGAKVSYVITQKHVEITENAIGTKDKLIFVDRKKTCDI